MPQSDKPREVSQGRGWARAALIAAIALSALAIFAVVARQTFLRHEFDLTTLIDDSAGIAPSSPVLLNGIDIGHVVRVSLSGSPDPNKTVKIVMRFPRRLLKEIPEDSTAAITSANLLGDKYMNISRGSHAARIQPGATIPSTATQDIGTFLSRANGPLNRINTIFDRIDRIMSRVDKQEGTLGKFINNPSLANHVSAVSGNQAQIAKNLRNGRGILVRLDEISAEAQKPMARLNAIGTDLDQGRGSLAKFLNDPYTPSLAAEMQSVTKEANDAISDFNSGNRTSGLLDRIQQVSSRLNETEARMESGQGTAGQFFVNPQLRDSLKRATDELNALTADIQKHPTKFAQIRVGLF